MAFSIGRAGLTLALPEPLNWQNSGGGTVTLTGSFVVSGSVTDSLRLRDQLLGLAGNSDEAIVPLISGAQPRDTGYYRVISVDIPTTADSIISGIHYYSIVLQPVFGYANPTFESIVTGALASNAIGAVLGDTFPFHAVSAAALEYFYGNFLTYSRSSADGSLTFTDGGSTALSGIAHWYLAPASYYIGAATFEQGSPLQPVIGRQLAQNDTVNWRLSNGLVRVTPNAVSGKLDVSHWKGAAWSAVKTYTISSLSPVGGLTSLLGVTVLRNSVEEVVIRLGYAVPALGGRCNVDLALRRGDRLVRGYIVADTQAQWQLARSTVEAGTVLTYGAVTVGGLRATANDADGNRYVIISIQQVPQYDTTNGLVKGPNSVTQNYFDFGIGSEIGGSGAVAPDDAVSVAKQYLAVQSEKQQTVNR